jgi:hypothetical protein
MTNLGNDNKNTDNKALNIKESRNMGNKLIPNSSRALIPLNNNNNSSSKLKKWDDNNNINKTPKPQIKKSESANMTFRENSSGNNKEKVQVRYNKLLLKNATGKK